MDTSVPKAPTQYDDINDLLEDFSQRIQTMLGTNLVGIYLTGSLSYGDFHPNGSDIDLHVVVKKQLTADEIKQVEKIHLDIEQRYPQWAKRIECSYTPQYLFSHIHPPTEPRPWIGEGIMYPQAHYGNEWIINNYHLYNSSITLSGTPFATFSQPIHMRDVQDAARRDLFVEWVPKIDNPTFLANSHYQSYLVLNLCRILYTVLNGKLGSKKISAEYVQGTFPQWKTLITQSQEWKYGDTLHNEPQTKEFILFAAAQLQP